MKVLSFIENEEIIRKILKHLGLWVVKTRPPPDTQAAAERTETLIDDSFSQLPVSDKWLYGRGKKPVKIILDNSNLKVYCRQNRQRLQRRQLFIVTLLLSEIISTFEPFDCGSLTAGGRTKRSVRK